MVQLFAVQLRVFLIKKNLPGWIAVELCLEITMVWCYAVFRRIMFIQFLPSLHKSADSLLLPFDTKIQVAVHC